ncbi:hypothetical protein ACFL20_08090 [Spirochaetota bacterium]
MIKTSVAILFLIIPLIFFSCISSEKKVNGSNKIKLPNKYNLKFLGYNSDIDNPENDRRSYYKIFINKVEMGRTTIGLESQIKLHQLKLNVNNHLLRVEKWVLDQKSGRYKKLNNIYQPKPNFFYFSIPENKIIIIKMKTGKYRKTMFTKEFEYDK